MFFCTLPFERRRRRRRGRKETTDHRKKLRRDTKSNALPTKGNDTTIASSFFTLLPQQGCSQKTPPRFLCGFFCVGGWSLFATNHSERSREVHRERLSRYLQSTVIIPTHSKRDRKSFTRMLALLQPLSYSYIKAFFLGVFLGVASTRQMNSWVKQRDNKM